MQTLEQRVERLERSCHRWRFGCLAAIMAAALLGATAKPAPQDADFKNLTAEHLTVRNPAGGPEFSVSADGKQTSLEITSGLASSAIIVVDKNGANLLLNHTAATGGTSASVGVDGTSGSLGLRDTTGKTKEIEPE